VSVQASGGAMQRRVAAGRLRKAAVDAAAVRRQPVRAPTEPMLARAATGDPPET